MKRIFTYLSFLLISMSGYAQVNTADSLALVDLYNATNGSSWTNNTNWLTTTPVKNWFGVKVAANRVSSLDLRNNNLSGSIPSSITSLSSLYTLILNGNNLSGTLPSTMGDMTNLRRFVGADNSLSGSLPASITSLTDLYEINLSNNNISGSIPSDIGSLTAMRFIWLNGNNLDGSIPSSVMNLSNLEAIALNGNNLSGSIPSGFGGIPKCREIYLNDNTLSGSIPSDIDGATALQQLWLDNNNLDGNVPGQILNCTNLIYLGLSNNQLTGNIYDYSGSMPALEWVFLNGNNFDKLNGMSASAAFSVADVSSNNLKFFQLFNATNPPATFVYAPQDSIGRTIDTTLSQGSDFTINVSDVSSGNTYEWYKNGVLQSETSSQYVITNIDNADIGVYHCVINNPSFPDLTLIQREVTIQSISCTSPVITSEPVNTTITQNFSTSLQIAADFATSYQWQVNTGSGFIDVTDNANYSGSTSDTLVISNVPSGFNGNQYRCIAIGGCSPEDTSTTVTLSVTTAINTWTKYVQDATYGNQKLNVTPRPTTASNVYVKPATRSGAVYYTVQVSLRSDFSSGVMERTGTVSTDWYFNNLMGDSVYYCRASVNGGAYTTIKSFVIENSPMIQGTSVMGKTYDLTYGWQSGSGNPTTATSVYCRPTPVSGATQWTVEVNPDPGFGAGTAITKVGSSWSTLGYYYFPGLTPNTTYYVRVMTDNEGIWGATRRFTTDGVASRPLATRDDIFEVGEMASAMEFAQRDRASEETKMITPAEVNVYPNPMRTAATLHVQSESEERATIYIMDLSGKVVEQLNVSTNESLSFGAGYSKGIYIAKVVVGNDVQQIRVIKE